MSYMLANPKKRRRRTPKRGAGGRFVKRGSPVKVRHVLNPRGRRRSARRRIGGGAPGFLSTGMLTQAGFGALGALTPSLLTDRVLPMVGFTTSGFVRRALQFAVPTVVLMLGGRRFLGAGTAAFATGAYAVTTLGLVNDLTGGAVALSGARNMGRYELSPRGLGRYELSPARLGQSNPRNGIPSDPAETLYS